MGLPLLLYIEVIYNIILVIVDRFLKIVRYISTINTINTIGVSILIIDYIISKFRVLKSIISDRESIFTSSY